MNKKERLILIELMNNEFVSGQELACAIQMSVRSLNSIIKNISCNIKGAEIDSGTFGYRLIIKSPEEFLRYLQQDDALQDEKHRLQYLFGRFMESGDYIRIEELCEELHLSRTSVKQSLREIRSYFEEYGIGISTKPHYGMCLKGSEINKRRAMAHFKYFERDNEAYDKIKNIIVSCIANIDAGSFHICDDALSSIALYLYIAYVRVQKKMYIDMDEKWMKEAEAEPEYGLGCAVMTLMNQMLGMEYREDETAYLTLHLSGRNSRHGAEICVSQEILNIVNEMMQILEEEAGISFSSDLNLRLALSLHMVSLAKRIRYKTYIKNPLLEDIKSRLIAAYELAIKAARFINRHYECCLPEDETGYLALYINLSLEKELDRIQKKNILVVCSSGLGSAKLLEYYFERNFKAYIRKLTVCSSLEMEKTDLDRYDCVFSTVPIHRKMSVPVFLIENVVDYRDALQIAQKLKRLDKPDLKRYFPKELFFLFDSFESREDAIHQIVERCHLCYKLPKDFEKLVLEREKIASTEFHEMAAFPHAYKPVADTTFVSVVILRKPLLWKSSRIRLIFLSSVEKGMNKDLDRFYRVVSVLLSDSYIQRQLIENPTYDNLADIIERIEA